MGWRKRVESKLDTIIQNQYSIKEAISRLEDTVWINVESGGQEALSRSPVLGIGSNQYDFMSFSRSGGDQYTLVFRGGQNIGIATMYIYKNSSLLDQMTTVYSDDNYRFVCQPAVYIPQTDRLFYITVSSTQSGPYYRPMMNVYEYDLDDESSSLTDQFLCVDNSASSTSKEKFGMSISYDPTTGKIYVLSGAHTFYSPGPTGYRTLRAWELDADGVEDHRIINIESSSSLNAGFYWWLAFSLKVYDGYMYYSHVYGSYGNFDGYAHKIDVSSVDSSSAGTQLCTSSWLAYDDVPVVGSFGLYMNNGSTTMASPGGTSWDVSSYIDTNRSFHVLRKIDSSDNFDLLTRKSSTVYLIRLNDDTTISNYGNRTIDSNIVLDSLTENGQSSHANLGMWPRGGYIGSAEKFLEFVPLTRDVI